MSSSTSPDESSTSGPESRLQNGQTSNVERTQADLAYKEFSHRILTMEIQPNERIVEQFWAKKLQVNRSAVRESLTRLLGEGLVHQGVRGGFFASQMTDEEIHEIRELREVLETAAFALACERATDKQIKEIEETCNDFANFVRKGYFAASHEADLRFHHLLIAASGNSRLAQLYDRAHIPLFQRKAAQVRTPIEDFIQTEKEHRMILEALRKRDKKLGQQRLKAHFNRGEKDALT
ncbi:MAG TPA: GntR family transcriptional regulator [Verrucomicrobiae bacterium]|jgi:DNA-binding GntR family transcriptional regulator|nr:GntR family transcriptional regulator [Verrucomicrobiae bacterium]